jgi:hypothetical protein
MAAAAADAAKDQRAGRAGREVAMNRVLTSENAEACRAAANGTPFGRPHWEATAGNDRWRGSWYLLVWRDGRWQRFEHSLDRVWPGEVMLYVEQQQLAMAYVALRDAVVQIEFSQSGPVVLQLPDGTALTRPLPALD